jgi:16S rRNA (guanine1207-N2)-methyltransferase
MLIKECICGYEIECETGNYYFSPKNIDKGTLTMLSKVQVTKEDKVLDLGCGYGIVGIYIAKIIGENKVVMSDISDEAIKLTNNNLKRNSLDRVRVIKSDGLKNIVDNDFTMIISNPPYHTNFSVAKSFIEDGFKKLLVNGKLIMVTKRLDWYKNKIIAVFGGVKIYEIDGYYVFVAEKRKAHVKKIKKNKNGISKKLKRKYGKNEKNTKV